MLCSKCKIFSIHLPNYDSYICENGHVLCRTCNDTIRQKCPLCGGRIVRQTEFRLEGVPTAFFKNSINEPVLVSDEESDMGPTYHSESMSGIEEWHCRYSGDVDSECGSAEKVSCCEDLSWNLNSAKIPLGDYYYMSFCNKQAGNRFRGNCNDIPMQHDEKCESISDIKENKSLANVKQSKSICKFRNSSLDENYITSIPKTSSCDPKELYHKTINGEVDFDPKQDYYKRVAQVNEIQEFYKRPNLELARKSSSRIEFKGKASQSDSKTILEHLKEFRNATNYVAPEDIEAYTVKNEAIHSEPTIITKSRMTIQKDSSTNRSCRENLTKSKIHEGCSDKKTKVDVGTMIDMCIEPCLNFINNNSSGDCVPDLKSRSISKNANSKGSSAFCVADFRLSKSRQISNKSTKSRGYTDNNETNIREFSDINEKEEKEKEVADGKEELPNSFLQSQKSLRNLLREKLKSEVYSQFQKTPGQQRNNFMTKTRYQPSPLVALHVDSFKDMSRANIADIINQEIEKALSKWSTPDDMMTPSQRREEVIKQSKIQVRERLLQQIYANFNNNDTTKSTIQSKSEPSLGKSTPREISLGNDNEQNNSSIALESILNPAEDVSRFIDATPTCLCKTLNKDVRNVALSTESYPKLNPELTILNISKTKEQRSYSNISAKATIDSVCHPLPLCDISTIHSPTDAEKEVLGEIQKQFQTQQRKISSPSLEGVKLPSQPKISSLTHASNPAESKNECSFFSDGNIERLAHTSENDRPKLTHDMGGDSQLSKLSEGPFIQSTIENAFQGQIESSYVVPKEMFNSPRATEITVATLYQNENVVQCVNYPGNPVSDDEFTENSGGDAMREVARNLAENYREEPRHKSQTSIDISDFIAYLKIKFPNISLNQIKEIIIKLPTDYNESTAELGTDRSQSDSAESKNNFLPSVIPAIKKKTDTIENISTLSSTTTNAWRAFYSPPSPNEAPSSEPTPQFKVITRLDLESVYLENFAKEVRPAAELNIPRSPVICPISTCNKLIFVSEFSKHIKVDHVKIPVESISPGKCKNLFLDPKVDHHGINKCHILYLVTDKIRDLGSREYKDFLPVLVMSTKVSLLELICSEFRARSREVIRSRQNYYMIWLTGLSPTDLPVYFSLTAWTRCGSIPKCHIVHSGQLYSIRNGQDARTLFKNGQVLLLSHEQCSMLTNDGRNMIELQVVVH